MISAPFPDTTFKASLEEAQRDDIYNNTDTAWRQFLEDHVPQLKRNATAIVMDEADMRRFQYRVRDYCEEKSTRHVELAFRIVNRLGADTDFNSSLVGHTIYVPSTDHVIELHNQYTTNLAMLKKI